jgi:hypothetical protein
MAVRLLRSSAVFGIYAPGVHGCTSMFPHLRARLYFRRQTAALLPTTTATTTPARPCYQAMRLRELAAPTSTHHGPMLRSERAAARSRDLVFPHKSSTACRQQTRSADCSGGQRCRGTERRANTVALPYRCSGAHPQPGPGSSSVPTGPRSMGCPRHRATLRSAGTTHGEGSAAQREQLVRMAAAMAPVVGGRGGRLSERSSREAVLLGTLTLLVVKP